MRRRKPQRGIDNRTSFPCSVTFHITMEGLSSTEIGVCRELDIYFHGCLAGVQSDANLLLNNFMTCSQNFKILKSFDTIISLRRICVKEITDDLYKALCIEMLIPTLFMLVEN